MTLNSRGINLLEFVVGRCGTAVANSLSAKGIGRSSHGSRADRTELTSARVHLP